MGIEQRTDRLLWGRYIFTLACAALPWADLIPFANYLLIILGAFVLAFGKLRLTNYKMIFDPLAVLFFLFYTFQLIALILVPGDVNNRFSVEQKASLLLLPPLIALFMKTDSEAWMYGVRGFITGLTAACGYCFLQAVARYIQTNDANVFFYHQYSSAVGANAIYLSLYVVIGACLLVCYYRKGKFVLPSFLFWPMLFLLGSNIVLLSSRMFVVLSVVLFLVFMFSSVQRNVVRFSVVAVVLALFFATSLFRNPIGERFKHLELSTYAQVMDSNDFANYAFNGLDLRLLLWRMGKEVLDERDGWLLGQGGRAYHKPLNEKKLSYHLFSGNAVTKDTGYLNYNMHNQYFENFMQYGIAGILVLLGIIVLVVREAIRKNNMLMLLLMFIFSVSFLTESILETQAGILLFTIFIYGEWKHSKLAK